jgi:hypothetical protein
VEAVKIQQEKKGLGYEKDLNFHILDYSKPIQFVSIRFLAKDLKGKDSNVPEVDEGVNDDSNNIVDKVDKHIDKIVSASNVIKLATWRQIALISILFSLWEDKSSFKEMSKEEEGSKMNSSLWLDGHLAMEFRSQDFA